MRDAADDRPPFRTERGATPGQRLTRPGLLQLIERLGAAATISTSRESVGKHPFSTSVRSGVDGLELR